VFAGIACAGAARAQANEPKRDVVFQTAGQLDAALPPPTSDAGAVATFKFIGPEAMIPGKVVKGAPFSATAVTETVQTLADGNRITSTISSFQARDSEGRTRREQSLPSLGPWASEGPAPKLVNISDPVSGNTYMLDDQAKTASKLHSREPISVTGGNVFYQRTVHVQGQSGPPAGDGQVFIMKKAGAVSMNAEPGADSKEENLGQTTVEGIVANGVRTTTVLPAGAIGNERPITVTEERWYSSDLQTTVLSKHSDPRMGETTFRLTNISRSEPAASLFQVPPDYQTVDASKGPVEIGQCRSS
jgi:hypothetical protein